MKPSTALRGLAWLLATAACFALPLPVAAQTYACAGATDGNSIALRDYVVSLVTAPASDTAAVNTRTRYSLPSASASAVTVETRRQTCDAAGQAYNAFALYGQPPISRNLVVVKVGNSRYVVLDPAEQVGEWQLHVVFDNRWQRLAAFAG